MEYRVVQSCWNGIAVLDPAPFYAPNPVKFRMARLIENECSASECGLICSESRRRGWAGTKLIVSGQTITLTLDMAESSWSRV